MRATALQQASKHVSLPHGLGQNGAIFVSVHTRAHTMRALLGGPWVGSPALRRSSSVWRECIGSDGLVVVV